MSLSSSKFFGSYLISHHGIDSKLIIEALQIQRRDEPSIEILANECFQIESDNLVEILNTQVESHKPFGDVAIELGFLTADQISEQQSQQAETRKKLGEILVEMGVLSEKEKNSLLAQYHNWIEAASLMGRASGTLYKH